MYDDDDEAKKIKEIKFEDSLDANATLDMNSPFHHHMTKVFSFISC